MAIFKRIFSILTRNLAGLAVMIVFIILIAFLPTAFSIRMPEPANANSGGERMQVIQLDKEWTISDESAAYMTIKSGGESVNFKFPHVTGYWDLDVNKPETMKAVATVDIASLDSGNAMRDHSARGENYLNADQYPQAQFELKSIGSWPKQWQPKKAQRFILKGNLTLHGVTKPVELDTEAKYLDGRLFLQSKSTIHMPDFGLPIADGGWLSAEPDGQIQLQLILEDHGGLSPEKKVSNVDVATLATPNPKADMTTTYKANVNLNPADQTVNGTVEIHTKNDTQTVQNSLYFHLYPNQFEHTEELQTPVWQKLLGTQYNLPGWIDISRVEVNGQEVPVQVQKTLLQVPLPSWQPGADATVKLDFHLIIPRNQGRIAYNEHEIWLGNWLPIRAVFEKSAWRLDPYYAIGDPFYSEAANYEVNATVPNTYRIASTGSDLEISDDGKQRRYKISAPQVREFAMVALDDTYVSSQENVGGVQVKTWYRKADNAYSVQQLHDTATKSIAYFNQHYGQYPFPEYDVVPVGFTSGMEYPGLVFINGDYFNTPDPKGMFTVLHETGHQWWYSAVGSDQIRESWLDEGLNDYTNMRYLLENDHMTGKGMIEAREKNLQTIQTYEKNGELMANSLDMFSGWSSYGGLAYQKGSLMFYHLDQAVGQETMDRVLQQYFETYRYKNAHGEDLISLFEQELGPGVRTYFETWLHGGVAEFTPQQGGKRP
ncbi:YceI family protein [Tumebacillus sp. ITR2]|uniref:YceI family protein n=1 Tax=Tumebacillus amylolyticus TaxID=2801339 RepID=A0ABS1JFT2_9BACL|nr:YceI family protein [Tumebacillus amylolyticus]MBL0388438.1 YceI family protein [Tumebacillus amylolyticus]